jgi:hypothetical protein
VARWSRHVARQARNLQIQAATAIALLKNRKPSQIAKSDPQIFHPSLYPMRIWKALTKENDKEERESSSCAG